MYLFYNGHMLSDAGNRDFKRVLTCWHLVFDSNNYRTHVILQFNCETWKLKALKSKRYLNKGSLCHLLFLNSKFKTLMIVNPKHKWVRIRKHTHKCALALFVPLESHGNIAVFNVLKIYRCRANLKVVSAKQHDTIIRGQRANVRKTDKHTLIIDPFPRSFDAKA